jgi:hypothetical protein
LSLTVSGAVGNHRAHPHTQKGKVITEADWNPYTIEELEEISKTGKNEWILPLDTTVALTDLGS